jgi:hypothetical protein
MKKADEVLAAVRSLREEFSRLISKPMGQLSADLMGAADTLALEAADEVDAGTQVTKRVLTYGPPEGSGIRKMQAQRACSLCREPGHRVTNCPNAQRVRQEKMAAQEARGGRRRKRNVKPLSEERKAQLREQLKKARAARRNK